MSSTQVDPGPTQSPTEVNETLHGPDVGVGLRLAAFKSLAGCVFVGVCVTEMLLFCSLK